MNPEVVHIDGRKLLENLLLETYTGVPKQLSDELFHLLHRGTDIIIDFPEGTSFTIDQEFRDSMRIPRGPSFKQE